MRLVLGRGGATWVEEGAEFGGYVVEDVPDEHPRAELRYALRGRDGRPAMLVASRRPLAGRRARSRFRRLAHSRAAIEHRALVPVHTFGERAGLPYLVMDPYPSRTFADLLADEGALPPQRLVPMLMPVAEALDLAHAHGLVHETLEAESLLVGDDGRLLLDSFGLVAGEDEAGWSLIQPREPHYRPPEQLGGEPLEPRANVYSLTALIVHALTGEPPYGGDRTAVAYAHLVEAPPRVSERAPELGPDIDGVVERGMSKEPSERHESAGELVREVARALGVEEAAQGAARLRAERRRRRGRRALMGLAAVALAAAAGILAAVSLDPFDDESRPARQAEADTAVWTRLADRRAELRAELAAAETPQDQAAAASGLAAAYAGAASAAEPARLAAAARDAGRAYSDLADAASAGDEAAFAEASDSVDAAERRLTTAAERAE